MNKLFKLLFLLLLFPLVLSAQNKRIPFIEGADRGFINESQIVTSWTTITGKPSVVNQLWYGAGLQSSALTFDGTILTASNITTNTLNINSNAPLQFNSRNSWRTYQTTQIGDNTLGWNISGIKLLLDEEFSIGLNGLQIYNNAGGTALTMTRANTAIVGTTVPNSTGFYVKMQADNSSLGTTPGFGGFVPTIPGTNVQANKTYIQRFRALLPVGYSFDLASNGFGNEGVHYWLTSQAGTGKWEEYVRVCKAGVTGLFSSSFHVYVAGSPAPTVAVPLVWYLASHTVIDATNLNEISAQVGSFPVLEGANGSAGTTGQLPINTGGAWNWTNSPYALATSITGTNHFVPKSNGAGGYVDSKLFQNNGALILDAVSPYFNMRNNGTNAITFGTDDALTAGSALDAHLYVYGANKLFLSTNGVKTFTIFGNQNVSIGSTTDNSLGKLQVTGNIYSTAGFFTSASTVGVTGNGTDLFLKSAATTFLNTGATAYVSINGNFTGRDYMASRLDGTGVYYFGGLTNRYLYYDGTQYQFINASLSMNTQKITGLADGTNAGDAINLGQSDARYARLTGATFTGAITSNSLINTSSSIIGGAIAINAVNPAIYRDLLWQTNGLNRWDLGVVGAESGSNNGSNMFLARYSDAGAYLGSVFDINRASGLLQFNQEVRGVAGSASTSLVVKSQLDAIGANISGTVNTYPIFTSTGAIGNGNITQNTTQIITSKPIFTNNGSVNLFNDGATGNSGLGVNLYWDNAQWNYNSLSYWGGRGNMLFINPISSNRFIFYESSNAANPAVLVQLAALSGTGLFIANGGFNSNNQKVINVANATATTDAVNKGQLDAAVSGTTNQIAYFTGANSVGSSPMYYHNNNGLSFDGTRAAPRYIYARGNGDDASLKIKSGSTAGYFSEISIDGWDGTGTPSNINFKTSGVDVMRLTSTVLRTVGLSKQNFYTNNSNTYRDVMYYDNNASTITGAFVIETPIVTTGVDNMLSLKILGYNYSGHGAWEVRIGGYTYNTTIPTWLNHSAEIIGNAPFTTVRLARNPATNKYIIILGGVTDNSWSYPKIHVSELIAGYSTTNNLGTGWSASFVTDVSAYTGMVTVNTQKVFKGYGVGTYQNTPTKLLGVDASGAVVETNPITSNISGTSSYIPLFTSTNTIGNSGIYQSNPTLWGFGTTSPVGVYGSTVHVKSSTGGSINLGGTTVTGYLSMADGLGTGVLGTSSNHPMVFITNGLERARYFTSGNIQFGGAGAITDNGNSLQVYKTGTSTFISVDAPTNGSFATPAQSGLKMLGYNGENARIAGLDYAANYSYSGLAFSTLNNASVLTERARFSGANGDFGIGTTTPQQKLHLANSGAVGIRLDNTAANTWDIINTTPSGTLDFIRGGTTWASIGAGGVATFNNNVATTGSFTATGGFYSASKLVALGSSSYVTLYRADGVAGIFLGGTADPNSYYDNTSHVFRNLAGSASLAQINSGGINIFGGKISNLANGTAATDAAAFGQIGTAVTNLLGTTNTWTAGNNFSAGLSSLNLNVGNNTGDNNIQIGLAGINGATGNRYAYVDFIGDNTYTDYGLRIIRNNGGANTSSDIVHRGTGNLQLGTTDAGAITLATNSVLRATMQANGVMQFNSAITQKGTTGVAKSQYVYSFDDGAVSKTGTLVLEMPTGWNNTMGTYEIEGFNYNGTTSGYWKLIVSGYNYTDGGSNKYWTSQSAQSIGNPPFSNVRLGFNATSGKNVIMLGTTTTAWAYPKLYVSAMTAHSYADYMNIGWSASWVTTETAYSALQTVTPSQNLLGITTVDNININTYSLRSQGYGLFYNLDNTNYSGIRNTGATGAANSNLDFFVGGNTVSRITPAGWLSLGTLSPISKLHVTTNAATATYATIGNMNGGIMIGTAANGENQIINYASKGLVFGGNFSTTQTEQMRLDGNGNLGVGISPTGRLDVLGASSLSRLVIGYQGTGVNYLDGSDLNVRTAGGATIATFNAAGISLIAPTTVEFFGHPRSVRAGYSGGNYGSISYGVNYTTTSNSHTYAGGDFPTRVDLYDGIYVTSAPTGTNGAAITWTQVAHLRRGGSTLYTSLSMASNKITALANGTATDEAVNLGQLQTINGSWITTGTVADARLSSNVALYNGNSYFTVSQRFRKNTVNDGQSYNNANIVLHTSDGSFPTIGFHNEGVYGAALQMRSGTDLVLQNSAAVSYKIFHEGNYGVFNLSSVSTGTLADARLTGNVALKNINNLFSSTQNITPTSGDTPLNLNKPSGTEWNYAQFNYAGTRRAYFGIEGGANFIIGLDGTNKGIILSTTGTGITNMTGGANVTGALSIGSTTTVTGTVISTLAAAEGGNFSLVNSGKTGAIANDWRIYNMTGGYGNGLVFWSYNQSGGGGGRTFNINDDGTLDAVRGTISANDATAARHLMNRQSADARYLQASGTTNYIPKFTAANTQAISMIFDNGNGVGVNSTNIKAVMNIRGVAGNAMTAGSTLLATMMLENNSNNSILTFGGQSASPFGNWIQVTDKTDLSLNYPLQLQPKGGNVIINGYSDNGARLQVTGDTYHSGKVSVNGGINTGFDLTVNGSSLIGSATITGLTTTGTLSITGASTSTSNGFVWSSNGAGSVTVQAVSDLPISSYQSVTVSTFTADIGGGTTRHLLTLDCSNQYMKVFKINLTNVSDADGVQITFSNMKSGGLYTVVYYNSPNLPLWYDSTAKQEDGSTNFSSGISFSGSAKHTFISSGSVAIKAF